MHATLDGCQWERADTVPPVTASMVPISTIPDSLIHPVSGTAPDFLSIKLNPS
jgi:hypothetical protein